MALSATGMYAERVARGCSSLLAHSAYGLAARCSAINSAMGDSVVLPGIADWSSLNQQDVGIIPDPPAYEMFTTDEAEPESIVVGPIEVGVSVTVKAWLPASVTVGEWNIATPMYRRLSWAMRAMFVERVRYGGRTLNDYENVLTLGNIRTAPIVNWQPGDEPHMAGVGVELTMSVTVCEQDTF